MAPTPRRTWSLTAEAFDRLLRRLAADPEVAGGIYEKTRRKLIDFFAWRGSPMPEAHADEAIDRLTRKLEEGEVVEDITAYVHGVAKRLLLESERSRAREQVALAELRIILAARSSSKEAEVRVACLGRCLKELPEESRALIMGYYQGAGKSHLDGRKPLADALGISYGTLKTRAHRLRGRLEECLQRCLETVEREGATNGPPRSRRGEEEE